MSPQQTRQVTSERRSGCGSYTPHDWAAYAHHSGRSSHAPRSRESLTCRQDHKSISSVKVDPPGSLLVIVSERAVHSTMPLFISASLIKMQKQTWGAPRAFGQSPLIAPAIAVARRRRRWGGSKVSIMGRITPCCNVSRASANMQASAYHTAGASITIAGSTVWWTFLCMRRLLRYMHVSMS